MLRITEDSYSLLLEAGEFVYEEESKFFCEDYLVKEENKSLIQELPKYIIYKFLDRAVGNLTAYDKPASIIFPDQLNTNLYKEHKLHYGEKIETIYYAGFNLDTGRLSSPVIKITYSYNRDSDYLLKYKTRTIYWMYEGGSWSEDTQVDIIPYLSEAKKLAEIKMVRNNIVEEAESLAKQLGLFDYVQELFEDYLDSITLYKEAGSRNFATNIAEDTKHSFWLDENTRDGKMTIREFLTGFFMIGTKPPKEEDSVEVEV